MVLFSLLGAPFTVWALGRVCLGECDLFDPTYTHFNAYFTVNGQDCSKAVRIKPTINELCPLTDLDCDNFFVYIYGRYRPPGGCCEYGIYVKINACTTKITGLYASVTRPDGVVTTVPLAHYVNEVFAIQMCNPGPYTVTIKRSNGEVLCTKTVYTESGYCDPGMASVLGRLDTLTCTPGLDTIGQAPINVNWESTISLSESEMNTDSRLWLVRSLSGVVISFSDTGNYQTLGDGIKALPLGTYVLYLVDAKTGLTIVRKHVIH